MNLQCSSIFTIFFAKIKLLLRKTLSKVSLIQFFYYYRLLWNSEILIFRKVVNFLIHTELFQFLYTLDQRSWGPDTNANLSFDEFWVLMYHYCVSNILQRIETVNKTWWYKQGFFKLCFRAKYNFWYKR